MTTRTLVCLIALLFPCGLAAAGEQPAPRRPNVLFIIADDMSWPHAGAYGDKVVKTPAFDRLAREGVLFNYAYSAAASCTISRNAILTGQQAGVPAAIDCLWGRNPSHRQVRTWSTSRDLRWLGVGAQLPKLMMYPQRIQR